MDNCVATPTPNLGRQDSIEKSIRTCDGIPFMNGLAHVIFFYSDLRRETGLTPNTLVPACGQTLTLWAALTQANLLIETFKILPTRIIIATTWHAIYSMLHSLYSSNLQLSFKSPKSAVRQGICGSQALFHHAYKKNTNKKKNSNRMHQWDWASKFHLYLPPKYQTTFYLWMTTKKLASCTPDVTNIRMSRWKLVHNIAVILEPQEGSY